MPTPIETANPLPEVRTRLVNGESIVFSGSVALLTKKGVHGDAPRYVPLLVDSSPVLHDARLKRPGSFEATWKAFENGNCRGTRPDEIGYLVSKTSRESLKKLVETFSLTPERSIYLAFEKEADIAGIVPVLREVRRKYPHVTIGSSHRMNILLGLVIGEALVSPRRAVIEIANDCNLRCDFCWTHSPLRKEPHPEGWLKSSLSVEKIFRFVAELAAGGAEMVELCAVGDPLFHPRIWEIIDDVKAKGLRLRISTNGTMISPKRAERFLDIGVDELSMNVSAGTREGYRDIHNVGPEIFDSLRSNLVFLYEQKLARDCRKPKTQMINVMTEKNLPEIPQMLDFARDAGMDEIDFRPVWAHQDFQVPLGITFELAERWSARFPEWIQRANESGKKNNLEAFLGKLTSAAAESASVPDVLGQRRRPAPCTVGYQFSLLDVNGMLRYCCHGDKRHAEYESLAAQWRDDRYETFRSDWRARFMSGGDLCRGCSHVSENEYYLGELSRLGLVELM